MIFENRTVDLWVIRFKERAERFHDTGKCLLYLYDGSVIREGIFQVESVGEANIRLACDMFFFHHVWVHREIQQISCIYFVGSTIEEGGFGRFLSDAEMLIGSRCSDASARRSLDEPLLDEIGFVDIFEGFGLFACCGRQGIDADGTAVKF